MDLYWPEAAAPTPLVIVAHGFARSRRNMAGWGEHLAAQGIAAAVPDLPAWSNHPRNGRFISQLKAALCSEQTTRQRIDDKRVGFLGFSAGGLASLLSAANNPTAAIWVGLDPVDWKVAGTRAAPAVECRALVLTAEPSACNSHGNASNIIAALPHCEHIHIPGAVHVDAEWPTDWLAELTCGRSSPTPRSEFRQRATEALRESLGLQPAIGSDSPD